MKTEPTEAYEAVKYYEANNINIDAFRAKKLCDMAFYEGQSSPNINQLEWEKSPFFKGNYEAKFGLGKYFIEDCGGCIILVCPNHTLKNKFSTIDEAKAAAQADFEKRVMECLDL